VYECCEQWSANQTHQSATFTSQSVANRLQSATNLDLLVNFVVVSPITDLINKGQILWFTPAIADLSLDLLSLWSNPSFYYLFLLPIYWDNLANRANLCQF